MNRVLTSAALIILLLLALTPACTPKVISTPAPAAPPPSLTSVAPAPVATPAKAAAPTPGAVDTQWARVMEAAKKEGRVVFLGSTPFAGDIGIAVSKSFEARTGIKLEILPGRGGSNYERIKTEKRSGQREASLVEASGVYLKLMKTEGLLAPALDLPVLKDSNAFLTHPLALDPEGYLVVFLMNWFGPYVNTRIVKSEDYPTSLKDFLKPEWKSKMLLTDPRTGSGTYWYYAAYVKRGITDWDYVKALQGQELKLAPNGGAAAQSLSRGEINASLISFSADTAAMVDAGAPIKALSMKEGDLFSLESISIVEGGPHTNAVKVFLNWFLGEEGQQVYARVAKPNPIRKDTPNYQPQNVIPQDKNNKKIAITMDDLAEGEKLFSDGYIAKLLGLAR
ncbi:MAG: extracellular solute-binding protein [Dehalococcoidia bacterium]|nr:extracellular solute-binding protein [Dehalococcoidia bacterium]